MPGCSRKGKGAGMCEPCCNESSRLSQMAADSFIPQTHTCLSKCTPVLPLDIKHTADDYCSSTRHGNKCGNSNPTAKAYPAAQFTTQISQITDPSPELVTQALQALQRLALNSTENVSAHVGVAMTASAPTPRCAEKVCHTPPPPCGCQTPRLSDRLQEQAQSMETCPRINLCDEKPPGFIAQPSPSSIVNVPTKRKSCSRTQSMNPRTPCSASSATLARCSSPKPVRNIALLTRPGCPFCEKAKNLLKDREMPFIEFPIRECDRKNVALAMTGETGVPQIWIDGKLIGGADRLEKWLYKHDPR